MKVDRDLKTVAVEVPEDILPVVNEIIDFRKHYGYGYIKVNFYNWKIQNHGIEVHVTKGTEGKITN